MDRYNPMEEDQEELDVLTGQPLMPNTPRDPDDPREKLRSYLAQRAEADKRMTTPEYRQAMREPQNILQDSNRELALGKLFMNAANQAGTIGGRAASTQGFDQYAGELQNQNAQALAGINRERSDIEAMDDRRLKTMQYLADKYGQQKNFEAGVDIKRSALQQQKEEAAQKQKNFESELGLKREQLEIERQKAATAKDPQKKAAQGQSEQIGKKVGDLSNVRSELAAAVKQLHDPNLSEDDKIRVAQGIVKTINMTQGTSDAIGAEEVGRLASELESSLGAVGKGIMLGAGSVGTAGAAIGGGLGAPVGGVGAIPGAAIGGGIGALGGGLVGGLGAAINESGKPGGFRLGPDVPGFTSRAERALDKVDATIARQTRLQELLNEGKSVPQANAIIDQEMGTTTAAVEEPMMRTQAGNVPSPEKMKILRYLKGRYGG